MSFIQKRGQNKAWENFLYKNLVTDFFKHEELQLVHERAKLLQKRVEKIITKAKVDNLANRRHVLRYINNTDVKNTDIINKIFKDIAPKYVDRKGGYTRVLKIKKRIGDDSTLSLITLVK